jgi:basic membrane protein A
MLQYAIDQALAGEWKPGYKAFGLAMGPQASGMVVCNASPEVKKKLLETEEAIRAGKIKTLEG